jgi:aminoglycoside phosphotransferase (APT) family kinase protein
MKREFHVERLAAWLKERLPRIPRLNLDPSRIQVSHVLNWGGFVNHSFSVQDGESRYHLKLTNDPDSVAKLQRWHTMRDGLERRYRAPRVMDWLDFPEIGFAGLVQQQIDGRNATFRESSALVDQLIELVGRLHKDADLASLLGESGPPKTCFDHFVETYIERFDADLEAIAGRELPFVSPALREWMRDETGSLREAAYSEPAFHVQATAPVHSDLNEGNVLVALNDWFVLDWDDLALGDPAVEFAVLLWPVVFEGGHWNEFSIPDADDAFRKRIELCFRAQVLDEVIDPLADYVAADAVPSRQAEVRRVKKQGHEKGLERYRSKW